MSNQPKTDGSARLAGRQPLPPDRKKVTYQVCLIPRDKNTLTAKYGSLTAALASLLEVEPSGEALRIAREHLQAAQDALAVSGDSLYPPRRADGTV